MKRFLMALVAMFAAVSFLSAQNESLTNYNGDSRFTDNWSVSLKTGYSRFIDEDYFGTQYNAQSVVVGLEKMVTPWLGLEPELNFRVRYSGGGTIINPGLNARVNLANIYNYNGERKTIEPVLFIGLGYGRHLDETLVDYKKNSSTLRTGVDLTFNVGEKKAWAIVVSPRFAWYDLGAYNLSRNTMLEVLAGVTYHFKTSNGTHSFAKAKLYNETEVSNLNTKINELRKANEELEMKLENLKNKPVETLTVKELDKSNQYMIAFEFDSYELTDASKKTLDNVPAGLTVNVYGAASPEGTTRHNMKLSENRAKAVAEYLESRGVKVNEVAGGEKGRAAMVIPVKK